MVTFTESCERQPIIFRLTAADRERKTATRVENCTNRAIALDLPLIPRYAGNWGGNDGLFAARKHANKAQTYQEWLLPSVYATR